MTKCWDETLLLLLLLLTEVSSDGLTRWHSVEMRHCCCCCCCWQKSGQMDSQDDIVLRWDVVVVVVVDRSQVRWTHKMTKCWDETWLLLLLLTEVRSDGLTRWQSVEMRRCCCCCWQKSGQMDSQAADEPASAAVAAAVDGQFTYLLTYCHDDISNTRCTRQSVICSLWWF